MFKKSLILLSALLMTATLTLSTFAADFTPSVSAKPAPDVVMQTASDGTQCAAILKDAHGNEVAGVAADQLIITPMTAAEESRPDIKEKLQSAYNQLKSAKSLTELSDTLAAALKEVAEELTPEDLVVRDLFDVSLNDEHASILAKEGNSITLRFKLSADADSLAAVLHNIEGDKWETIPNDQIVRNEDNTADVTFTSLSPVAFLFDAGKLTVDPNAPKSPETGEPETAFGTYILVASAIVLTGVAAAVMVKKKHSGNA